MSFAIPQDAEDAFYDAIDECNLETMRTVWGHGEGVLCLLPMAPPHLGHGDVMKLWGQILREEMRVDIQVRHLQWIEAEDFAIHFVEEQVSVSGQAQQQPPMYATNIYRRGPDGWSMIVHQNSPPPPPQGVLTPGT